MNKLNLIAIIGLFFYLSSPANAFTCEQKVGQMIVTSPPPEPHPNLGGVIYFRNYIDSLGSIESMKERFANHKSSISIPPFISFDNEGGHVQRLRTRHGFRREADEPNKMRSRDEAALNAGIAALNVSQVGGNLNFGTVLDICEDGNPIIQRYGRCFSHSPDQNANFGLASTLANSYYDVIPTIKHFPGHGSTHSDSHIDYAPITRDWASYYENEVRPFSEVINQFEDADYRQQIEQGVDNPTRRAPAVMVGHMTFPHYEGLDPNLPASLNRIIVTDYLRNRLGHSGLIISDDIGIMDAVRKDRSLLQATIASIRAGNDIVIIGNSRLSRGQWTNHINFRSPEHQLQLMRQICEAAQSDDLLLEEINSSFRRVIENKRNYGILGDKVPNIRNSMSDVELRRALDGVADPFASENKTNVRPRSLANES